jgi:putative ABC transport system permease protein
VYFRLLAESLRRGSRRKLLAATAVALGLLGATAIAELLLAAGDRLAAELGSYGANLEVVPAEGRETFPAADLALLRKIFWRNNIVAVAPLSPLRVRFTAGGGEAAGPEATGVVAPLVGTWFDQPVDGAWRSGLPATRPTLRIAGRWPADGAAEAAVGRRLAARLGLAPGTTAEVEIGGRRSRLAVVGVVESGGEEEEMAFAPLAAVRAVAGQTVAGGDGGDSSSLPGLAGDVPRAEVFALTNPEGDNVRDPKAMTPEQYDRWYCTAYPSSIAYQIGEALPGARARVVRGITAATADLAGRLRPVLLALAAVALAGAAVGVTAVMTATVLERRLEAGLAVALGAETWKVSVFFLSEAALLGLVGGLAGGALGLVAGRLAGAAVFGVAVPWAPVLLPLAAGAGVVLAVAGSLPAVIRPLVRDPAAILKRATA